MGENVEALIRGKEVSEMVSLVISTGDTKEEPIDLREQVKTGMV